MAGIILGTDLKSVYRKRSSASQRPDTKYRALSNPVSILSKLGTASTGVEEKTEATHGGALSCILAAALHGSSPTSKDHDNKKHTIERSRVPTLIASIFRTGHRISHLSGNRCWVSRWFWSPASMIPDASL